MVPMNESVDLSDISDQPPAPDFRRSGGAPMVHNPDGSGKWLRYSRPSSWGSDLDDEAALTLWRIDRAMDGVAASPALAAKVAVKRGIKEGRKELRDEATQIGRGEEAADLGTALHAMTVRVESNDGWIAPEPFAADLAAYLTMIDGAGLESIAMEVHLCNDTFRAAGTADRIYRATRELVLPDGYKASPGTCFMGDIKTGKKLDYSLPGYAIQLALYTDSCLYDVMTNERTPLPNNLHMRWGVLIHLPANKAKCDLSWIDLDVGRKGAEIVREVREWRKRKDFQQPFCLPDSDMHAVLAAVEVSDEPVIVTGPPPADADEWMAVMIPYAQRRIDAIGRYPEARGLLLRKWPESVPPLRVGGHTTSQVSLILDLLDAIEAAYSLPFPVPPFDTEGYKSAIQRTNEPPTYQGEIIE